jgi:hypothetical protein
MEKRVDNSVVEITKDNQQIAFPNKEWNSWEIGNTVEDHKFIGAICRCFEICFIRHT